MTQMDLFAGTSSSAGRPAPAQHRRILASAGSGKTYQLTRRYLQLVHRGVPVHAILASTFTRLAAGEIRDRILITLARAAREPDALDELRAMLGEPTFQPDDAISLLATLTRNVHRMQVRTLDGFFASVVRCFTLELGLPPDASIVDEVQEAELRARAVQRVLNRGDAAAHAERLSVLTRGLSRRSVSFAIDTVVRDLYDVYRQSTPEAWSYPRPVAGQLGDRDLDTAIDRLESTDVGGGKRLPKALASDCGQARAGAWSRFLESGLAAGILNDGTYYGNPIEPEVIAAYEPVVRHAAAELIEQYRAQTEATGALLGDFHTAFEAIKREQRGITFSDLVMSLTRVSRPETLHDVFYRIDGRLDHLLLDEFQDTSVPQWQALEAIAREIVSDESRDRSFFCVGDIKQSIYGWRDAAPEVLDAIPDLLFPTGGGSIGEERLDTSYRSSPVIMNVANRTFQTVAGNRALARYADAAASWGNGYPEHTTARTTLTGYAELRTVPRAEGRSAVPRLRASAALIADLHRRAPEQSIGVLTRSNKAATRLLFELGPGQLNIDASGRGAAPPTDAPAVNAVLDLLRLADHPSDTISAFNVATSPLAPIVGAAANLYTADAIRDRLALADSIRARLLDHGYGMTIAAWTARLAPACDQRELHRLQQVVELAEAFDANADRTCRPSAFVRRVERAAVTDFKPSPVQVMTIHKSKGLEFDIVVLCDLDDALINGSPQVVFEREHIVGDIVKTCRWIDGKIRPIVPALEPLFTAQRAAEIRESLCLLYVAMTRARRGLYMVINAPKDAAKPPASLAGIVFGALADGDRAAGSVVFRDGDEGWLDEGEPETGPRDDHAEPSTRDDAPIELLPGHTDRPARATAPAASAGEHQVLRQRLEPTESMAMETGTAIHALFEQIEWIETFDADDDKDDALVAALRCALPRAAPAWCTSMVERFRDLLGHADIRSILSRGARPAERVRVYAERPYARLTESGLQKGYIDRLVVEHDAAGRPVAATVIDFKTDLVSADSVTDRAEHHRRQLEQYRVAVSEQLGLDRSAIDAALVFTGPGVVVFL